MARGRDVEAALEAWRAAERVVGELAPGIPERVAAEAEVERLREQYQTVVEGLGDNEPKLFLIDPPIREMGADSGPDTIAS